MPKCKKCGEFRARHEMEEYGGVCKFCTGKYHDPCKGCGGEDCACCSYGQGY